MGPDYIQANTKGRLHAADEPSVAPLNRGFLYGDAVYEVWRTYERVLFAWEEHWERLEGSAAALHLTLPLNADEALEQVRRTVRAFRTRTDSAADVYVRLQITRGGGPIGLDTGLADAADYVILVQENKPWSPEKLRGGVRLSLAEHTRRNPREALDPAWKTGNYLNNVLALREAKARGADEVLITNLRGEITEAAVCNVGFVRGGEVLTPALASGLLAGVTRRLLLRDVAPRAGIAAREAVVRPEELDGMDECFLLSTTKDITPVAAIDEHSFVVREDSITSRLKAAFAGFARDYAARRRAELAV